MTKQEIPDTGPAGLAGSVGVAPLVHKGVLQAYKDWRMAKILLLGLVSGFPWVLIASMMSLWLKAEGLSRTGIGLFGIVFTVYAFNMFWAPVVDTYKLPFLHRLGQRRSWIVLMQFLIAIFMLLLTLYSPKEQLIAISVITFLIALSSATQDVAVDALRIELIGKAEVNKVGAGSAMATAGWWLGFGGMGAIGLFLAEYLEKDVGLENYWQATYAYLVLVIVLSVIAVLLFIKEPESSERVAEQRNDYATFSGSLSKSRNPMAVMTSKAGLLAAVVGGALFALFSFPYLKGSVGGEETAGLLRYVGLWLGWLVALWVVGLLALFLNSLMSAGTPAGEGLEASPSLLSRFYSVWYLPLASFVRNHGVRVGLLVIALVFLFKVGEAFLGRMSIIFYKEVGFSKSDIALYSKGFGTLALCVFAVIGSLINARYGLFRGLLIGGIAMASTNLLFAVLAVYPEKWLFAFAVITDQFTTAMSTVALVAFLSQLCDRAYTATQYAAFASLGNFSRTTLAISSGAVVDGLGGNWSLFFILTTVMVLPALALLLYVRKDLKSVMEGQTTKLL